MLKDCFYYLSWVPPETSPRKELGKEFIWEVISGNTSGKVRLERQGAKDDYVIKPVTTVAN